MSGSRLFISTILIHLVLLESVVQHAETSKILLIFPLPLGSHMILGQALGKGLVEAGHEVTMISPTALKKPMKNYRDVLIPDMRHLIMNVHGLNNTFTALKEKNQLSMMFATMNNAVNFTELIITEKEVNTLLNSPNEHFDAVIVQMYLSEALYAIANHFNAPLIVFSTLGSTMFTNHLVGNYAPLAAIPDIYLGVANDMKFSDRLKNTLIYLSLLPLSSWYTHKQAVIVKKYFKNAPPLEDLMLNTSLVLLNSHISLTYPRPLVPNMIEIGGFHISKPKPLPEDLQKFIDESPHGVIYFSMGSNLNSTELPSEYRDAFLKVFSSLKQRVLWKWEDENLSNKPNNLMISKWFPQTDILAHPNVKMFITHGGLLSSTEAVARGVPILSIPVMADQKMNSIRGEHLGYGVYVDFANITEESISWGVNEILNNPKYTENIKQRTKILQDQEVEPLQKAIYWVEYVIRHKGAHHLRCSTTGMPLYKFLLLDVIGVVIIVSSLAILFIYLAFRCLCRIIFCKKCKNSTKKTKKD